MRSCAGCSLVGGCWRRWGRRTLVCMGRTAEWGVMNSSMGSTMEVPEYYCYIRTCELLGWCQANGLLSVQRVVAKLA